MFRISQIIPFLLVFATLAVTNLSFRKTQAQSWRLVAIVLFISSLMDAFHFAGPYTDSRFIPSFRQWRSVQYHDAYQILRNISQKEGPCYLFSEFNTDYDNKTLDVTCYPFDVLQNPSLSKDTPTWAAIIINAQYAPFLIRDFPGLRFKVLKTDKYGPNDPPPFGIFLIPVNQIPKEALTHWVQADRVYRETDLDIRNMSSALSWGDFSERLSPLKDINKDDRFLTTIYWEKCGFYNFLGKNFTAAAEDYQNAIRLGYPAAHLYYSLGVSLKTSGKVTDGQKALNKVQELSIHPFID
jgi:hypothetical protein